MSERTLEEVLRKIHETTTLIIDLDDDPGSGGEHHDDFKKCMELITEARDKVKEDGDLSEVDNKTNEIFEKWEERHPNPEEIIENASV